MIIKKIKKDEAPRFILELADTLVSRILSDEECCGASLNLRKLDDKVRISLEIDFDPEALNTN